MFLSQLSRTQPQAGGTVWTGTLKEYEQFLLAVGGGGRSSSGIHVTPESALRCAAVFACVRVIAEDVSKLPLILYKRRRDGGKDRATWHPLYRLTHDRPNAWMTSMGFREMLTAHVALRGKAYAFVNRIGPKNKRVVKELIPIHPDRVTPVQGDDYEMRYVVRTKGGGTETYGPDQILPVCGLTLDGVNGLSPIAYHRESIGLAMAAEKYGAQIFGNGAKMGGILEYPHKWKDPGTADKVAESFDAASSGDNANRTIVLEEGMKWTKVSMTADDAQFLETRKFQVTDIARIFRVPPHKIMDLERATFGNIEQQALEFVSDCLMSWTVRWEQAMNASLLTEEEQGLYFFEHLFDALLRGDTQSRFTAYQVAITNGILSPDEARRRENLNPRQDGHGGEYWRPANMEPATNNADPDGGTSE